MFSWIYDFLKERRQRVVLNGIPSRLASVNSGIPQRSVLGPLLFILYVNDMPEAVTNMIKMFADNTEIFAECKNNEDRIRLQEYLELLDK